jgi:hypothetical protein
MPRSAINFVSWRPLLKAIRLNDFKVELCLFICNLPENRALISIAAKAAIEKKATRSAIDKWLDH